MEKITILKETIQIDKYVNLYFDANIFILIFPATYKMGTKDKPKGARRRGALSFMRTGVYLKSILHSY